MSSKAARQSSTPASKQAPPNDAQHIQLLNDILDVSTQLISTLDPDELIATLIERVVQVVPGAVSGLLWLHDQQGTLQLKSFYGLQAAPDPALMERLRLRPGEGLIGLIWQRGEALVVEGHGRYIEQAGRVSQRIADDMHALLVQVPPSSLAALIPLHIGKQIIGVLELFFHGEIQPAVGAHNLQMLQTFADLVAGAINNAQLHAKMQAQQYRLEALGAIGTVVSMAADLEELLTNALDVILHVLETSAGMLLLHDLARGELSIAVQRGLPDRFVRRHGASGVAHSPYEETVRYGQTVTRPLIAEDGEELLLDAGFNSCVYLPLLAGGTVVGVVGVYGDANLRERVDVPALMTMGSQLGLAIANVRLYQDTRTERLKLATVINSIAEGVVLCNGEGRLVLGNRSAIELLSVDRLPPEQSVTEMPDFYGIRDLDGNPLPVERLPMTRALAGEIFHDYRLLSHGASGQDTVLSFSGAPVYDDDNNIDGAVTIFRDITSNQKLERAKDDFLAVAAHELRSPLAAVRGYTDLLVRREQRRGEEDSSELRGLNILAQQVTHMLRMVDNILDVSRIDAGQVSLQVQPVNLVALAEQVIEQQRPSAGDRWIELDAPGPELQIVCDSLRIRQVLTNLVGNAIRYSAPGTHIGVRLSMQSVAAIAANHPFYSIPANTDPQTLQVLIAVRDQGSGISEDQLSRLFRRYARGRERRAEGLGLGLYLSREFVARHGGEIWAESREGQGSTFFFTLPLVCEHSNGVTDEA